jgi:uncharacterized surface protein with fasciclin (FAS1) repeats
MNVRHRVLAAATAAGVALVPVALSATTASAATGTKSLASVLLKDTKPNGNPSFDNNGKDFDILTAAILGVLDAKPSSSVGVLTDGTVKLTAFLPTDKAFERTGADLGLSAKNEEKLAGKYVKTLGVDGLEQVLLYHVVPGAKINAATAAKSDGAALTTAQGQKITVNVTKDGIFLKDRNSKVDNPKVIITDINKGNRQIAHGISRVLLPSL